MLIVFNNLRSCHKTKQLKKSVFLVIRSGFVVCKFVQESVSLDLNFYPQMSF